MKPRQKCHSSQMQRIFLVFRRENTLFGSITKLFWKLNKLPIEYENIICKLKKCKKQFLNIDRAKTKLFGKLADWNHTNCFGNLFSLQHSFTSIEFQKLAFLDLKRSEKIPNCNNSNSLKTSR